MPKQHKNATEIRAFIHESDLPAALIDRLLKISELTVRKWHKHADTRDGSHIPKQLYTRLKLSRKLSLDERLTVCKEIINSNTSRAGLPRCLKRYGVSRLADIEPLLAVDDGQDRCGKALYEICFTQSAVSYSPGTGGQLQ